MQQQPQQLQQPQLRPPALPQPQQQPQQQAAPQPQHQARPHHVVQQLRPPQPVPAQPGTLVQPRPPQQQPPQQPGQQQRPLQQALPKQVRPPAPQSATAAGRPAAKPADSTATPVKRPPKKRKAPDDPLARAVNPFPESLLFQQLVAAERDADALLTARRAEVAACLAPAPTATKKLRVYIFATHSGQPAPTGGQQQGGPPASEGPPAWALHVHGRVLELSGEPPLPGALPPLQPFSHYLRTLTVKLAPAPVAVKRVAPVRRPVAAAPRAFGSKAKPLAALPRPKGAPSPGEEASKDGAAAADAAVGGGAVAAELATNSTAAAASPAASAGETITWSAAQHAGPHRDAFDIRRLGSAEMRATVTLEVDWRPQRYHCSPQLAAVVGMHAGTRPRILQAVCAHIAAHSLEAGGSVTCDARLRAVVGADQVAAGDLGAHVAPHLTAAPPVTMQYAIKPSGPSPSVPDCYDIEVEVPLQQQLPASAAAAPLLQKIVKQHDFSEAAGKVEAVVKRCREHLRRRTLLLGFSQDPAQFINGIVATQARDLRQLQLGEENGGGAVFYAPTRTELFHGRWIEDACLKCMRGN